MVEGPNRVRLLVGLSAVFGLLVAWTVISGFVNPPGNPPCNVTNPQDPTTSEPYNQGLVPPALFILGAIVAAVAGRYLSQPSSAPIRGQHAHLIVGGEHAASGTAASESTKGVRIGAGGILSAVWLQFAVWILMSLAVIALSYETFGVANGNNPWPITFLIRCINNRASIQTLLTTVAIFFVIGSWFLFRDDEVRSHGHR